MECCAVLPVLPEISNDRSAFETLESIYGSKRRYVPEDSAFQQQNFVCRLDKQAGLQHSGSGRQG